MQDDTRQAAIDAHIQNDAFARLLGAEVNIVAPGHSRVSLTVTDQMTNFHGITHGGVIFALGDMAFAAAKALDVAVADDAAAAPDAAQGRCTGRGRSG